MKGSGDMHRAIMLLLCAVMLIAVDLQAESANATPTTPDFTGVYYPFQQGRGGAPAPAAPRGTPPPPPTRSAPTSDLRNGRAANAPSLTPEYMAKWEIVRKS